MGVAAVVVAGGRGERFGGLKQFAELAGRTIAERSVLAARSVASLVVLVVPEAYVGAGEGADVVVVGGVTRSDSVRAGLSAVGDAEIIVVHDAARPLASAQLFRAVVDAVRAGAPGAVPGVAVTDTIKRVRAGVVAETLDRAELVSVQTPQAFARRALVDAHASGLDATDDAALVERLGLEVVVVAGDATNVKVTTTEDLARVGELERSLP